MTEVEIRPLGPDDDLDAQLGLHERAYGAVPQARRGQWRGSAVRRIGRGAYLGAFAGGRPVGAANYHDMRQWWHGRSVPMAGVSGVKMAPEYRGRGIGRRMMTELLGRIAERGYPLSTLWAATAPIYRSLGWELAGSRYLTTVPSRELRALLAPDPALDGAAGGPGSGLPGDPRALMAAVNAVSIRPAGPEDAETVLEVIGRVHEAGRHSGPLTFDAEPVRDWLADDQYYAYLADDGYLAYRWKGDFNGGEIAADRIVAASPATARALWSVLAGYSSVASTISALLAPDDPLWWLTRERDVAQPSKRMWMLRVVDAPAAIAARGFPPAVSLSVPLLIADQSRPSNSGHWRLEVSDGKGTLTPAANGGWGEGAGSRTASCSGPGNGGGPVADGGPAGKGGPAADGEGAAGRGGPGNGDEAASRGGAGNGGADPCGRPGNGDTDPRSRHGNGAPLTLGARGLAALYGGTPVATLRHAGLASGGSPESDAALDAAFPGPSFMLDSF